MPCNYQDFITSMSEDISQTEETNPQNEKANSDNSSFSNENSTKIVALPGLHIVSLNNLSLSSTSSGAELSPSEITKVEKLEVSSPKACTKSLQEIRIAHLKTSPVCNVKRKSTDENFAKTQQQFSSHNLIPCQKCSDHFKNSYERQIHMVQYHATKFLRISLKNLTSDDIASEKRMIRLKFARSRNRSVGRHKEKKRQMVAGFSTPKVKSRELVDESSDESEKGRNGVDSSSYSISIAKKLKNINVMSRKATSQRAKFRSKLISHSSSDSDDNLSLSSDDLLDDDSDYEAPNSRELKKKSTKKSQKKISNTQTTAISRKRRQLENAPSQLSSSNSRSRSSSRTRSITKDNGAVVITSQKSKNAKKSMSSGKIVSMEGLPLRCTICPFGTAQEKAFAKHRKHHRKKYSFQCTVCSFSDDDQAKLRSKHMPLHNNIKKKNVKKKLSKSSAATSPPRISIEDENKLESMMPSPGSSQPILRCNGCPFQCRAHDILRAHKKFHNSSNKYRCRFCDYSSATQSYLNDFHEPLHFFLDSDDAITILGCFPPGQVVADVGDFPGSQINFPGKERRIDDNRNLKKSSDEKENNVDAQFINDRDKAVKNSLHLASECCRYCGRRTFTSKRCKQNHETSHVIAT